MFSFHISIERVFFFILKRSIPIGTCIDESFYLQPNTFIRMTKTLANWRKSIKMTIISMNFILLSTAQVMIGPIVEIHENWKIGHILSDSITVYWLKCDLGFSFKFDDSNNNNDIWDNRKHGHRNRIVHY